MAYNIPNSIAKVCSCNNYLGTQILTGINMQYFIPNIYVLNLIYKAVFRLATTYGNDS